MGKKARDNAEETRQKATEIEAKFSAALKQINEDAEAERNKAKSLVASKAGTINQDYQAALKKLDGEHKAAIEAENKRLAQEVAALKKQISEAKRGRQSNLAKLENKLEEDKVELRRGKSDALALVEAELGSALREIEDNKAGKIAVADQERLEGLGLLEHGTPSEGK